MVAANQSLASRVAALETTVSERMAKLEAIVAQQQRQIERLERLNGAGGGAPVQPPPAATQAVAQAAAGQLNDSVKELTEALERKLRASEDFGEASRLAEAAAAARPRSEERAARLAPQTPDAPKSAPRRNGAQAEPVARASGLRAPLQTGGPWPRGCSPAAPPASSPAVSAVLPSPNLVPIPPLGTLPTRPEVPARPAGLAAAASGTSSSGRLPRPDLLGKGSGPGGSGAGGSLSERAHDGREAKERAEEAKAGADSERSGARRLSGGGGARGSAPSPLGKASAPSPRSEGSGEGRRAGEARSLVQLAVLQGPSEMPVTALAVSECGSGLVSAGLDGDVQLWSRGVDDSSQGLGTTTRSAQLWVRSLRQPVGGGEVNGMALQGSILACGCQDGSIRLYRLLKEAGAFMLYSLLRLQHSATPASTQPKAAGAAAMRAAAEPTAAAPPAAAAVSEVMCVALSSAATSRSAPLLVSGAQDGSVCTWDCTSGRLVQSLAAHDAGGSGWVMALALSRHADNKRLLMLSASYDHSVKVWLRSADALPLGGTGASTSFGSSSSFASASAAAGSSPSGGPGGGGGGWALELTLSGHTDGVLALELSRSRKLAFSGSNDMSVRVWELGSGACLHVLTSHTSSVSALGWHPASGCLVSTAEDGAVLLWDAPWESAQPPSPQPAHSLLIEHCEVLCLRPSADGTALFCGLDDGGIALLGPT